MGNDGLDTPQEKLTADTAGNIDKYPQEGGPKPPILGVPAVSFQGPGSMFFFSQSYCLLANKNLNFKHVFKSWPGEHAKVPWNLKITNLRASWQS